MFPFSFEWVWDAAHLIFMGGLWYALTIIGLGMTFCIVKAAFIDSPHGDHGIGDHGIGDDHADHH